MPATIVKRAAVAPFLSADSQARSYTSNREFLAFLIGVGVPLSEVDWIYEQAFVDKQHAASRRLT